MELSPAEESLLRQAKEGAVFSCLVIGPRLVHFEGRSEPGYSVELPGKVVAFLHDSQTDFPQPRELSPGEKVDAKLIKIGRWQYAPKIPSKGEFSWDYYEELPNYSPVVSVAVRLREDQFKQRQARLGDLEVGKHLEGTVKSVLPYGVFVDVGGIGGLVTDVSKGDSFLEGEKVNVEVVDFDRAREVLSLKFL